MRLFACITIVIWSVCLPHKGLTQSQSTSFIWLHYYHNQELDSSWTVFADINPRFKIPDLYNSLNLFRLGLEYKFGDNWFTEAGYAMGLSGKVVDRFIFKSVEYRPFTGITFRSSVRNVSLIARYRFEFRYFDMQSDDDYSYLRHRFRMGLEYKLSIKEKPTKYSFVLANELFINTGGYVRNNVLDNNRLLTGVRWQVHQRVALNFIYNFQFGQRRNSADELSNILWISCVYRGKYKN